MQKTDRMNMLKKLTLLKGSAGTIFSSYIPDHYDEIYSFYNLLNDISLDYANISFKKPIINEGSFVFCFSTGKDELSRIKSLLKETDGVISYMRGKSFGVNPKGNYTGVQLIFTKIKK